MEREKKMGKGKLTVLLVMALLLGALAGSLATKLYVKHRLLQLAQGRLGARRARIMRVLDRNLHLSPDQRRAIRREIDWSESRLMALRNRHLQEMEDVLAQSKARIERHLTPRQRERFELLYARMQRRLARCGLCRRRANPRNRPPRRWHRGER